MTYGQSLSNLADNLAEGIHKIKYKYRYDNKKCETQRLNTKTLTTVLNTEALKII